jgi:hypothetical protein
MVIALACQIAEGGRSVLAVGFEPLAKLLAERLILGRIVEIHRGSSSIADFDRGLLEPVYERLQ